VLFEKRQKFNLFKSTYNHQSSKFESIHSLEMIEFKLSFVFIVLVVHVLKSKSFIRPTSPQLISSCILKSKNQNSELSPKSLKEFSFMASIQVNKISLGLGLATSFLYRSKRCEAIGTSRYNISIILYCIYAQW
jgi:hypothetical protein